MGKDNAVVSEEERQEGIRSEVLSFMEGADLERNREYKFGNRVVVVERGRGWRTATAYVDGRLRAHVAALSKGVDLNDYKNNAADRYSGLIVTEHEPHPIDTATGVPARYYLLRDPSTKRDTVFVTYDNDPGEIIER